MGVSKVGRKRKSKASSKGKGKPKEQEPELAIQDIKSETDEELECLSLEISEEEATPAENHQKSPCVLCSQLMGDSSTLASFPLWDRLSLENHSRRHSEQSGWELEATIRKCFPNATCLITNNDEPDTSSMLSPISLNFSESPRAMKRKISLTDETLEKLGLQKATKIDLPSPSGRISIVSTSSIDGSVSGSSSNSEYRVRMAQLTRHVRSGAPDEDLACQFPGCSFRINRKDTYAASIHIPQHCGKDLFKCSLCSFATPGKNKAHKHLRQNHPNCEQKFEEVFSDETDNSDPLLSETVAKCFPYIRNLDLWHSDLPESIKLKIKDYISTSQMVSDEAKKIGCCGDEDLSEIGVFRHVTLNHFEPSLFKCLSCQYRGNDVWSHLYKAHKYRNNGKDTFKSLYAENVTELEACFDKFLGTGPEKPIKMLLPKTSGKKKALARKSCSTPLVSPTEIAPPSTPNSTFLESVFEGVAGAKLEGSPKLESPTQPRTPVHSRLRARSSQGSSRKSTPKGSSEESLKYPPGFKLRQQILARFLKHQVDVTLTCQIPECQYVYSFKNGRLGNHMMAHIGKRLLSCAICTKKESNRDNMYSHFTKVHPETHHNGHIIDNSWAYDDTLVKLCHRAFPVLDSLSTWFPSTPPTIVNLIRKFLEISATNRKWQLGCCQENIPLTEIGVYRHVVDHFNTPLFNCFSCGYEGQEVYEHVSEKHYFAGKHLFEDNQSELLPQLAEHFRFCLSMADEPNEDPQMKTLKRKSTTFETHPGESKRLEPGALTNRLSILRAEIKKMSSSQKLACSYPECGKEATEHTQFVAHLAVHIGKLRYQCSACGARTNHPGRHEEKHPEEKGTMIDKIAEIEVELNECLDTAFPLVAEVEFWQRFYPEDNEPEHQSKFEERIFAIRLENQGKTLVCKMCDCEIPRKGSFHANIDLRSHIISHFSEPNLFKCNICEVETSKIWVHHVGNHRELDYDFVDRTVDFDSVLESLAEDCFDF